MLTGFPGEVAIMLLSAASAITLIGFSIALSGRVKVMIEINEVSEIFSSQSALSSSSVEKLSVR